MALQYKIPFAVFGILAIISSLFSMAFRVHHILQLRKEVQAALQIGQPIKDVGPKGQLSATGFELADCSDDFNDPAERNFYRNLDWELLKVKRDLLATATGMLVVMCEGETLSLSV